MCPYIVVFNFLILQAYINECLLEHHLSCFVNMIGIFILACSLIEKSKQGYNQATKGHQQ